MFSLAIGMYVPSMTSNFIPANLSSIVFVSGFAAVILPSYYKHVIIEPWVNFPEEVAKQLRRAVFYSFPGRNHDVHEANKYFRQALVVSQQLGMDPFSPEILGVKYLMHDLYWKANHHELACDVLEVMRMDCQRWMDEYSHKHWTDGNRARVLKVMVQISVKLAELYDCKYMNEPDNAERRLVWAVETALSEKARREKEGVKEGEGDWLTDEEMGGTLEGKSPVHLVHPVQHCATLTHGSPRNAL